MFSKVIIRNLLSESNILGLVVANVVKINIAGSLGFLKSGYSVLKRNVKTLLDRKIVKYIKIYSFLSSLPFIIGRAKVSIVYLKLFN
jgi:hypothetical protein